MFPAVEARLAARAVRDLSGRMSPMTGGGAGRTLILLRHGEARHSGESGASDRQRPLTERGRRDGPADL